MINMVVKNNKRNLIIDIVTKGFLKIKTQMSVFLFNRF